MKLKNLGNKQNILLVLFFIFFTLSYTVNILSIANPHLFHGFERQPEGLVVGRLVRSAHDGVFSYGGLTGINHSSLEAQTEEQYAASLAAQHDLYITNKEVPDTYMAYKSQSGGQGIVFSLLHKILPLDNAKKLMLYRGLNAILLALIFCLFGRWVGRSYGLTAGLVTLLLILFSPWLTIFGHNLWWVLWSFYLPFATMLLALECKRKHPDKISDNKILAYLFLAVFLKCFFTGFEFISTTLVSAFCPIVYYAFRENIHFFRAFIFSIKAAVAALLAVVAETLLLITQIKLSDGTYTHGINHIVSSFFKRSEFGTDDTPLSVFEIITTYLKNDAFQFGFLSNNQPFYFALLLAIIGIVACFIYIKNKKNTALVLTFFFSLLAPLSWLIVFKQHAANHQHMDYIIWYIPTLLYGFCILGIGASALFETARKRING